MSPIVASSQANRRAGRLRSRTCAGVPLLGLLGLAMLDAHAQDASTSGRKALTVVPSVSVNEMLTNNAKLSDSEKRADLVSEVTPAIRMQAASARFQGSLDYSVMGLDYARGTDKDSVQQNLAADMKAQLVDDAVFFDANANVSRQNISPLGTPTPDAALRTSNQTQVSSFAVDPYVRGRLGGFADYQLGVNYAWTHAGAQSVGDTQNASQTLHVGPDAPLARVNWAVDASRQTTDFSLGRKTTTESVVGSLLFTPVGEVQLSLRGGREANDLQTVELHNTATYGGGLRWIPSERTSLSIQDDKHFYGNSYSVNFEHRSASAVLSFGFSRSGNFDSSTASQGQPMTAFDLVYLQLTSKYPDPIARANQALIDLQALGLNPLSTVPSGFLTNAVSLQKSAFASFGYLGQRSSLILSVQQSESTRLDTLSSAVDLLSDGGTIRLRSATLSASRQLTPQSSASLNLAESRSYDLTSGSRVDLRSVVANWSTQLGMRTQMSLGARHSIASGESSYVESALLATLTLQF